MELQAPVTPSTAHLIMVALFATHAQPRVIFLSFQVSLNLKSESAQVEQVPHVSEHIAATPSAAHRMIVCLFATQSHPLVIFLPFQVSLNLKEESTHSDVVVVPEVEGEDVDATGLAVGESVSVPSSTQSDGNVNEEESSTDVLAVDPE